METGICKGIWSVRTVVSFPCLLFVAILSFLTILSPYLNVVARSVFSKTKKRWLKRSSSCCPKRKEGCLFLPNRRRVLQGVTYCSAFPCLLPGEGGKQNDKRPWLKLAQIRLQRQITSQIFLLYILGRFCLKLKIGILCIPTPLLPTNK